MPRPFNRRRFLAGAAAFGASLATAGCAGTYDVAAGLTGSSGGENRSTLVYWNLLSGDGTHMEAMEAAYSKAHPGVNLQSTILTWGNPYYTRLALAIRSGSPPDVAIMHLSRIYEFGPPGLLTPLSLDLLAAHGMQPKDFTPLAFSKAHFNGQQLAIPLDTHPFVQYYNTKLCGKAGLLDSSGQLPPVNGAQAMLTVLRRLKRTGVIPVVCDQVDDPATAWRLFYTLYSQGGGKVLADNGKRVVLDEALAVKVLSFIYQMATEGLLNANVDANGGTALFQAGTAALYWEGEWQVDVYQAANVPFSMQPFPALFGRDVAQADSHTFIIPRQASPDPEKLSDGADHDPLAARPEPDLGGRGPHTGVAAGPRLGRLQETQAAVQLRIGCQPGGLRPARLVQRIRVRHGELRGGSHRDPDAGQPQPASRLPGDAAVVRDPVEGDGAGMTATAVRLPKTAARKDRRARRRRDGWGNAGLLAPFMIFYLLFLVGPLVYDVVMSFFNTSLVLPGLGSFAGRRNYTELFGDSRFWQAMWHTILFTLVSTPPLVIIPLFFAIVVNRIKHGQWFFRLAFFLPYILPSAVIALIWTWLYEPGYGLIDGFFSMLGLGAPGWLSSPNVALYSVVIVTVWWTIGFNFVLYLAGQQDIPRDLYEASALDGAGRWKQTSRITIPMLGRTTTLVTVLQVIASLKIFDQVYLITAGGPNYASRTAIEFIYDTGFTSERVGYASAASLVLFLVILLVSFAWLALVRKQERGV